MKILLIILLVLVTGCTPKGTALTEINTNLSSNNPNISAYYNLVMDSKTMLKELKITNETFYDITKADPNFLLSEEEYYSFYQKYTEWILPQYNEMIKEISNAKYQKIDDINSNDGLLMILENIDNHYKLYIYSDNKIKVVDGNDRFSYQAETNLSTTYSLLDNFHTKLNDFISQIKH